MCFVEVTTTQGVRYWLRESTILRVQDHAMGSGSVVVVSTGREYLEQISVVDKSDVILGRIADCHQCITLDQ